MKKVLLGLALLTAGIYFSGCLKSKEPGCPYQDITTVTKVDSQIVKVKAYLDDNNIEDYIQDSTGFFYKITTPGTGELHPGACSQVIVKYKGMLTNNTVFDQSTDPVNFQVGNVIAGWQLGLKKITKGAKMTLYLPPYLGYGNNDVKNPATGAIVIPRNSILIFDVELIDAI